MGDDEAGPSSTALDEPAPAPRDINLANHPSGIVPQLQNVVATVNLDTKLDLKMIALHARNAEYNPKRFAAVIMRIREPKTTALVFASGKMVCTGAKSEQDSRLAARKYARIVQKLGFNATFKDFQIQNIVGSCDVRFPIRLEGLAHAHSLFASYEPELFPGLIYRMKQPKVVLLIFVSGKVVLTGAKERQEIYTAFENIYPTLQEFRKGDPAALLPSRMAPPPDLADPRALKRSRLESPMLPPASPMHRPGQGLPPPTPMHPMTTPLHTGASLPPPTPLHASMQLPPPTPVHQGLPPATPGYSLHHTPSAAFQLPPPTPLHQSLPPPTPLHHSLPPPTPVHRSLPPPTPGHP